MREPFLSWYLQRAKQMKSVLCVGLDPTLDHLPPQWARSLNGLRDYLCKIIDLAAEKAAVMKPQSAYYEAYGPEGLQMLIDLVDRAHNLDVPVILDAKRADIGETMKAYGCAVFDQIGADACTFVPYLGSTFSPAWHDWFDQGRCAISMIRTSNPEAAHLQDQCLQWLWSDQQVYEWAAEQTAALDRKISHLTNGRGSVGGVVGATVPEQAVRCRELAPDTLFLIPGYGAQGGGAEGAVTGFPKDGRLLGTVNSSRGITQAWRNKDGSAKPDDPLDLVAAAIDAANAELNAALAAHLGHDPYAPKEA